MVGPANIQIQKGDLGENVLSNSVVFVPTNIIVGNIMLSNMLDFRMVILHSFIGNQCVNFLYVFNSLVLLNFTYLVFWYYSSPLH